MILEALKLLQYKGDPSAFVNSINDQGKLRYQGLLPLQWFSFSFLFKMTSLNRMLKLYLIPQTRFLEKIII